MNRKTILSALSILALFAIIGIAYAVQAPYQRPIGTIQRCVCTGTVLFNGQQAQAGGGIGAITRKNSSPDDPNPSTDLEVIEFSNTQQVPELGTVTWTVDPTRPLQTRIQTNVTGSAFPATSTFRFHANVSINGRRFRTANPIELQATVNEWPARNAQYRQIGQTVIEGTNIVVSGINVTVNPA